jgi:SNF2 family DNA or RNA helicase
VKRSQTIMTFNTSDNANVMIMAVQRAAYGIDLSSASRVYFCSPVWQAAMEQQAIKRAHRIGQTKPVFVEILVIRHSIEDALLKRRNVVAGKKTWGKGHLYDELNPSLFAFANSTSR